VYRHNGVVSEHRASWARHRRVKRPRPKVNNVAECSEWQRVTPAWRHVATSTVAQSNTQGILLCQTFCRLSNLADNVISHETLSHYATLL